MRVHLPLKQGLRQRHQLRSVCLRHSASASSIKTRIKTFTTCADTKELPLVRVHLPLKQGLRHPLTRSFNDDGLAVRVHLPLKQGLRR